MADNVQDAREIEVGNNVQGVVAGQQNIADADNFVLLDNNQDAREVEVGNNVQGVVVGQQNAVVADNPVPRASTPQHEIHINVTDRNAPIVLLFGAQGSGKTMTLIRLGKYLRARKGYTVSVDRLFCANAWEYAVNADKFNGMLNTRRAAKGTDYNDFLLIQVKNAQGGVICQILEGAGEDYFPKHNQNVVVAPLPNYMATVFASPNRKCWIFLAEYRWQVEPDEKARYVDRVKFVKTNYSRHKDKFIILGVKADLSGCTINANAIHEKNAERTLFQEYRGLDSLFKTTSVLPWINNRKYKFVPYITGYYGNSYAGGYVPYVPADDIYPAKLWKAITSSLGIRE